MLPPIILETERLQLRPFTLLDAGFVLELFNTPKWLRFIGDRQLYNLQDAEQYLTQKLMKAYDNGFGFYVISLLTTQTAIGIVGFVKRPELPTVDMGYALLPTYEGKGYAYEAAAATLQYGLQTLQLGTVAAIITPDNTQSIQLIKKLGFQQIRTIVMNNEELLLMTYTPPATS